MNFSLKRIVLAVAATSSISATALAADTNNQLTLTLEGAKRAVAAAIEYAHSHGAPGGSIAVVDAGGSIVYVERLEGSFPASADVSIGKARTAANFRKATRAFEDTINKGRYAMIPVAAVTDFTPLQGGVPLIVNGQVVGAIGVSGASSAQQDEEIATAGAQALAGDAK